MGKPTEKPKLDFGILDLNHNSIIATLKKDRATKF